MALVFMDGCDHYGAASHIGEKWTSAHANIKYGATSGRFGGGAIIFDADDQPVVAGIGSESEMFVQFVFRQDLAFGSDIFLAFKNGANNANVLKMVGGSATIQAIRDTSTVLEESTEALSLGVFHYIEVHLKISQTVGIFKVIVNDTVFIDFTGDTQGAQSTFTQINFTGAASANDTIIDDIIIMDTSGSINNSLIGDTQIETVYPDGDTAQKDFTPTGAGTTNADRVDDGDAGPDEDTTYVESSTVGHKDLYTMAALATANIDQVFAVQAVTRHKKDDAGTRTARNLVKSGTTTSNGASIGLINGVYEYGSDVVELNPDTSTAWTETTVNAAEVGQEVLT